MSETLPLSAERLRELEEIFRRTVVPSDWYRKRHRKYLDVVERVRGWNDDDFRLPHSQKELWEEGRAVGGIGPGQNVDTSAVYRDHDVINEVVALRGDWSRVSLEDRAALLRQSYDLILGLISPRLSKRRPAAKLLRVFATLLPEHFHRCFNWKSSQHVARLVLGQVHDPVSDAVLVRDQLRKTLGEERDLAEHVDRSFFCWWLHEQYARLAAGEEIVGVVSETEAAAHVDDEQDTPLVPWSFQRQRKTMPTVSGYVDTLRAMIQSCEGGASQDDALMTMREEHGLEKLQARTFWYLMNTSKVLGLLDQRDGLWWPSDAGKEALETDPPDILVARMLERVFGMIDLLRIAVRRGPSLQAELLQDLLDELRVLYPSLRTDHAPKVLLSWANSLGLMEREGQNWQLTDYGSGWVERLPKVMPAVPAEATRRQRGPGDEDVAGASISVLASRDELVTLDPWVPPSFVDMWAKFEQDDVLRHFVFDEDKLQDLHLAWHPPEDGELAKKRFVILSGLSGTGKTAILTHYARIYCRLAGVEHPDEHCTIVAVSPDWRDPGGLLGYVNALTPDPTYLREPALVHLLEAEANSHQPYFLILDEMNLAHPEHYFAPFLSAMETGGWLELHAHDSPSIKVPSAIRWPRNLFIGGTVNMDETTHAFSDKVLDRAFTIELWDVDLPRFFERRRERDLADVADIDAVHAFFIELNNQLRRVRRHVGYRSVGEAIDFVRSGARAGLATDAQALWSLVDRAVHAKVLPRLRGHDSDDLRKALGAARQVCEQRGLTRCTDKLARMLARLDENGVTRFFS